MGTRYQSLRVSVILVGCHEEILCPVFGTWKEKYHCLEEEEEEEEEEDIVHGEHFVSKLVHLRDIFEYSTLQYTELKFARERY
jgi:hypothetical protein